MENSNDCAIGPGSKVSGGANAAGGEIGWPAGNLSVGAGAPARGLVRFLYSSNPFYILMRTWGLVGLRLSFGAGGRRREPGPFWWGSRVIRS